MVNFDTRAGDSTGAERLLASGPGIDRLSYRTALKDCPRSRLNVA